MVDPQANIPTVTASSQTSNTPIVKPATPELFIFKDEVVPVEVMTDLIFEDIGGQELLNISRNDIINGQNVLYQPIKNISSIFFQYNPQNILNLQDTSNDYFKNFPIKLENKVPNCGSGYEYDVLTGIQTPNCQSVYIDPQTGDLVIDIINLSSDEQVEVQIMISGSILNDTIYEVNN
jgi:hypothetical protein